MESSADISLLAPRGRLRIIPFQKFNGAINMALDSILAEKAGAESDPVLRFYGWEPFCLSLGRHQNAALIDRKRMQADGVHLVRRPTGGSAVLHANELTYSLIVPGGRERHHEIYRLFHHILAQALNRLQYDVTLHNHQDSENYLKDKKTSFACFNRPAFTEIKYRYKKVVGSAQRLLPNALLQHGSVLLSGSQTDVLRYLSITETEKKRLYDALRQSAVSLEEINSHTLEVQTLEKAIKEQFACSGVNSIYSKNASDAELRAAEKMRHQFIV